MNGEPAADAGAGGNDLVIRSELAQSFPTIVEGLGRAQRIFERIKSFEDIEREFLLGAGLSPNTYRSYLTAVKQLYRFTEGLNPLQVTPAHIEAFYDDLAKRVDRSTAYLRVAGLKRFFAGIRNVIPFYTSPFEIMQETLQRKLTRSKKGNRTKKSLTVAEVKKLLAWLGRDPSPRGKRSYAIIFMLVTSGLRAAELLQLRWKHIECTEGTWTARFVGKGGKDAEQELFGEAVEACRQCFRAQFRRDPQTADALFWTEPAFPGDTPRPLCYHTLWRWIRGVGQAAREQGVISRELAWSPHLFRRSYATALYKSGMKIKAIQEKTRHASIDVLVRHYIDDNEPASPYFEKMLAEG